MDGIIEKVIESEYRAQKIISEVEEEKKRMAEDIEKKLEILRQEIFLTAERKLEDARIEKEEFALRESEKILAEAKSRASDMVKKFSEKKDEWVQNMYDCIVR